MRVMLIEDNQDLAATIIEGLDQAYSVDWAATGGKGTYMLQVTPYDAAIIDIGLPDMSGLEVCSRLRAEDIRIPVLMLTAHSLVKDKVEALDNGADDYLTKPFQFAELQARLRALIRRGPSPIGNERLRLGELVLDTAARSVHYGSIPITLKRKEFDILEFLLRNQNVVVTRGMLIDHVWDSEANELTNAVDVHVGRLRKLIKEIAGRQVIHTVYGFGYRIGELPLPKRT